MSDTKTPPPFAFRLFLSVNLSLFHTENKSESFSKGVLSRSRHTVNFKRSIARLRTIPNPTCQGESSQLTYFTVCPYLDGIPTFSEVISFFVTISQTGTNWTFLSRHSGASRNPKGNVLRLDSCFRRNDAVFANLSTDWRTC